MFNIVYILSKYNFTSLYFNNIILKYTHTHTYVICMYLYVISFNIYNKTYNIYCTYNAKKKENSVYI